MPADGVLQLVTILIILILVMAAAFFTTRYIAKFQQGHAGGRNIELLETYRLSPTKYVQIVRLGKTYVAIAVCKDTVTFLKELQEDELTLSPVSDTTGKGFQDIFDFLKKKETDHSEKKE